MEPAFSVCSLTIFPNRSMFNRVIYYEMGLLAHVFFPQAPRVHFSSHFILRTRLLVDIFSLPHETKPGSKSQKENRRSSTISFTDMEEITELLLVVDDSNRGSRLRVPARKETAFMPSTQPTRSAIHLMHQETLNETRSTKTKPSRFEPLPPPATSSSLIIIS